MQLVLPNNNKSYASGDLIITDVNSYVVVNIFDENRKVLEEKYYKDKDNRVRLRDIGNYMVKSSQRYALKAGDGVQVGKAITMNIQLIDENAKLQFDTGDQPVFIYPCESICDDITNIRRVMLTRCRRRRTRSKYIEYISVYENEAIEIRAVYLTKNGEKHTGNVIKIHYPLDYNMEPSAYIHIFQYDVSVGAIASLLKSQYQTDVDMVLEYLVCVKNGYEERSAIHYTVEPEEVQDVKTFVFRNSFLATETVNTYSPQLVEYKWKRETGTIGRNSVSIANNLEKVFTVRTGAINKEEVYALEDMLNSTDVGLLMNDNILPIVVLGETFKVSEANNELVEVEWSYRIASNNQLRNDYKQCGFQSKVMIFGDMFDRIFN